MIATIEKDNNNDERPNMSKML